MTDPFQDHRTVDAEITSNAADGFTIDINGTQVFFKQGTVPVLVEIYVEDESHPIAAINIAKGETVLLGGQKGDLLSEIEGALDNLSTSVMELEDLRQRINPAGASGSYLPDAAGICPACGDEYTEKEVLVADRFDKAWGEADDGRDFCIASPQGEEHGFAYYHEEDGDLPVREEGGESDV